MNNGGQRMVRGKRIQFSVKIHIRGMDPNASAGRVQDLNIRMDLCNRDGQRGTPVNDSVFAKQNDLAGG